MLAGVPALVSDLPGVRLPVQRTGFGRIVPPADVPALRDGLAHLRDDPPDPVAGRAAASEAFSVESVLDDYEAVFTKAAG
jgi:glycosyltransferase involved in cell wall biosynthesis